VSPEPDGQCHSELAFVFTPDGDSADFTMERTPGRVRVTTVASAPWRVKVMGAGDVVATGDGGVEVQL
jgi:hypothetical protein